MTDRKSLPEVDVCVVGLGAVGALVAYGAARGGRKVVGLEAGPPRSGREAAMDEVQSAMIRNEFGEPKFNHEVPTWRLNAGSPRRPMSPYARMANGLGGTSSTYAATSLRFHPDDFRVRSNTIERYGVAALPAGSDIQDWPLSYDDLEPYYDEAEYLLGISGQAGNIQGRIVPGGNPFEGPRRREYPMPPLRKSGYGELFREASAKLGYQPFPVPTAITTTPYDGRPACTYCSYCTRMGCHVNAKGSTAVSAIPHAVETGNLEIRTGCRVTRVVTSDGGEVIGVDYEGPDGGCFQPAGAVVLAAYSFENVRLMLLSTSKQFPSGIGNAHSQLGLGYMTHASAQVSGLMEGRKLRRFIGPYSQGVTVDDLNADNFDHTGLGFIRGGRIFMLNQCTPILDSRVLPPDVPRWGGAYKGFLAEHFDSVAHINVSPEVLPYEMNFLDLDPEVRDRYGRPVIRITFDLYENERRMTRYLLERANDLMQAAGATKIWRRQIVPTAISTHDAGGTRIGTDPKKSVADSFGRVHTAPRLIVAGGSTYPTHSGMNSTLTMQALGLRTGLHLAGKLHM